MPCAENQDTLASGERKKTKQMGDNKTKNSRSMMLIEYEKSNKKSVDTREEI